MTGFTRSLMAAFDLDGFLSRSAGLVVADVPGANGAVIFLYESSKGGLAATSGAVKIQGKVMPAAAGPAIPFVTEVFESGKPRVVTGRAAAKLASAVFPGNVGPSKVGRVLCVPMALDGARIGCLLLTSRRGKLARDRAVSRIMKAASLLSLFSYKARVLREGQEKRFLELVSTLSHELRTPLTCIKGYATALLHDRGGVEPEARREFLEIIDEETDAMKKLLDDLMESSMIESGFLRIAKEPVLLGHIARKAVEDARLRTKKHHFILRFPPGFPIVEADPARIRQVLDNLLDNAVKYSPSGGLVVVQGAVANDEVIISVADEGIGIAPEHLNRLFEKFYRVRTDLAGTGLGLPVAREIVEKHGGRIWARSTPGKGSIFYFTLPLTDISRTGLGLGDPEVESGPFGPGTG